ncbi:MAG TPA: SdrD B-like domain-containing protein [Caldilineaceae bacterium]|nr:SdrD B-like domain-containing protein [Caldilineaceae bacterium]
MPQTFLPQSFLLSAISHLPIRRYYRWRTIALAAIALLSAFSFLLNQTFAATEQTASLRCRLLQTSIETDQETTFILDVLEVSNLYGYELSVKFNAGRIHFQDADSAKAGVNLEIGNFLSPDFVVVNTADNSTGKVQLALTQLSPRTAISGTGELARATITGISAGVTDFTLSSVVLSDPTGKAIPVQLQNCNLEVIDGGTPTPTTTPTTGQGTATPSPTPSPVHTTTPDATGTPSPTPTVATGSISGVVFEDINQNGIHEPGEPGLRALVKLYLLDSDRQWATLSNKDGDYLFNRLPGGEYFIEITPLINTPYIFTTSAEISLNLLDGTGVSGVNFGIKPLTTWVIYLPALVFPAGDSSQGRIIYLPSLFQVTVIERKSIQFFTAPVGEEYDK